MLELRDSLRTSVFPITLLRLAGVALAGMGLAGTGLAQYPELLKDLQPGTTSSSPEDFENWDGKLFFKASKTFTGTEPWISDGTTAGTQILKDIRPGPLSSLSSNIYSTEFQGLHYFVANDGSTGSEVWVSDGTTAGTQLFYDFEPGLVSSSPAILTFNGALWFTVSTSQFGRELWVSDGTVGGTQLFTDLNPGPDSGIYLARVMNGSLFISGNDGIHGYEPWICDGSLGSLQMLKDVRTGIESGFQSGNATEWNGDIMFAGNEASTGYEPWITDMTPGGTQLVLDINPGTDSSSPYFYRSLNLTSALVFSARTAAEGTEPWRSDGTAAGTFIIEDYRIGPSSSQIYMVDFTSDVGFYTVDSEIFGYEPFLTDGTLAGTVCTDVNPGPGNGTYYTNQLFYRAEDKIYFPASQSGVGVEIGVSDGTVAGTKLVRDLLPGSSTSFFGPLVPVENYLFYMLGGRLAYTNGEAATTNWMPKDTTAFASIEVCWEAIRIDDRFFFSGTDGFFADPVVGHELWVMQVDADGDGTPTLFDELTAVSSCECEMAFAPCGNGDMTAGCASSLGSGANMMASGTSQLANDDLVLTTTNAPASTFGLMFMGPNLHAPLPLGDGLRCVGGGLRRWPIQNSGAGGSFTYGPGMDAFAQANYPAQFQFEAGASWHFQTWFRDVSGPCGNGSNLSNAMTVIFTP